MNFVQVTNTYTSTPTPPTGVNSSTELAGPPTELINSSTPGPAELIIELDSSTPPAELINSSIELDSFTLPADSSIEPTSSELLLHLTSLPHDWSMQSSANGIQLCSYVWANAINSSIFSSSKRDSKNVAHSLA